MPFKASAMICCKIAFLALVNIANVTVSLQIVETRKRFFTDLTLHDYCTYKRRVFINVIVFNGNWSVMYISKCTVHSIQVYNVVYIQSSVIT